MASSLGRRSLAGLRHCCAKASTHRTLSLSTVGTCRQTSSSQAMSSCFSRARLWHKSKLFSVKNKMPYVTASAADVSTVVTSGRNAMHRGPQDSTGSSTFQRAAHFFSKCQAGGSHRLVGLGGVSLQGKCWDGFPACWRYFTSGAVRHVSSLTGKRSSRKKMPRVGKEEAVCGDPSLLILCHFHQWGEQGRKK